MPVRSMRVHFVVGLFLSLLYGFIYTPRAGLCIAVGIALLKEHEDLVWYHDFDWKNTVIMCFGGMTGFVITNMSAYF